MYLYNGAAIQLWIDSAKCFMCDSCKCESSSECPQKAVLHIIVWFCQMMESEEMSNTKGLLDFSPVLCYIQSTKTHWLIAFFGQYIIIVIRKIDYRCFEKNGHYIRRTNDWEKRCVSEKHSPLGMRNGENVIQIYFCIEIDDEG